MWGPNPNRNPNYGGPWLWRVTICSAASSHRHQPCGTI